MKISQILGQLLWLFLNHELGFLVKNYRKLKVKISDFLHPTREYSGSTASRVNKQVESKFNELLSDQLMDSRLESPETDYSSKFNMGLSKAFCFINRRKIEKPHLPARCLVIKCGADFLANQFMALTNASFAAESLKGKKWESGSQIFNVLKWGLISKPENGVKFQSQKMGSNFKARKWGQIFNDRNWGLISSP